MLITQVCEPCDRDLTTPPYNCVVVLGYMSVRRMLKVGCSNQVSNVTQVTGQQTNARQMGPVSRKMVTSIQVLTLCSLNYLVKYFSTSRSL